MITPLITKLQKCKDSSELQNIYDEILVEYDNLNFPDEEFKSLSKHTVTEPIELFTKQFDSEILRNHNIKLLENIKLFDSMYS